MTVPVEHDGVVDRPGVCGCCGDDIEVVGDPSGVASGIDTGRLCEGDSATGRPERFDFRRCNSLSALEELCDEQERPR